MRTVTSQRELCVLPPYCTGWDAFPQLLKLLIAAFGSPTRAFHSCSPCGLLQHGFLVEQMAYCVESYCIFVSLIFIYSFHCLPFSPPPPPFFFPWEAYSVIAEFGIAVQFIFVILIFTSVCVRSILQSSACFLKC